MRYLNRRFVLQGLGGIALGLPFLEGLAPRTARAAPNSNPKRVVFYFMVNGVRMDTWWPVDSSGKQLSATTALTDANLANTALQPLQGRTNKLTVLGGTQMWPPGYTGIGCDHKKGMGHKLTAAPLDSSSFLSTGPSADQVIASATNPAGRRALTLAVGTQSDDVLGYVSYTGNQQPVKGENNPWYAYRDFMAMGSGQTPDAGVMIDIAAKRKSVIDLVAADFDTLKMAKLSKNDKDKLDYHLTTIRALETSMPAMNPDAGSGNQPTICALDSARAAQVQALNGNNQVTSDTSFETIGKMQIDVMALAIACNFTTAGSILFGRGSGGPVYKWVDSGMVYNHHPLSHRATSDGGTGGNEAQANPQLLEIDTWNSMMFAYLMDKLDGYSEGDGTVLDNTAAVFCNELSDGETHNYQNLPYLIGGSLGGYLKMGQYINGKSGGNYTNHNVFLNTLINGAGVQSASFGAAGADAGELAAVKA